jgi:hypothetical protein
MSVQDTLTRAIRMTGGRALNDTPSAAEMAEALAEFQNMVLSLPRVVLTEVVVSANYTANENERITDTSGTAVITKPTVIVDSRSGLNRPPHNGSVVEIANAATPLRFIYITELGSWMQTSQLALSGAQPFGPEHEQGLAAMIAARIAGPIFQREPPQMVILLAQEGRRTIRQRFRQPFVATTDPLLLNVFQRNGSNV